MTSSAPTYLTGSACVVTGAGDGVIFHETVKLTGIEELPLGCDRIVGAQVEASAQALAQTLADTPAAFDMGSVLDANLNQTDRQIRVTARSNYAVVPAAVC